VAVRSWTRAYSNGLGGGPGSKIRSVGSSEWESKVAPNQIKLSPDHLAKLGLYYPRSEWTEGHGWRCALTQNKKGKLSRTFSAD
jgi:hypothetical protein